MVKWALPLLLLAGCATDPRIATLRQNTSRLEDEVLQHKLSEEEAHRLLDAQTAELYGPGKNFCDVYYPRFSDTYYGFAYWRYSYTQRFFPGCYVERTIQPRPLFYRFRAVRRNPCS